jgi:hypothetical protein
MLIVLFCLVHGKRRIVWMRTGRMNKWMIMEVLSMCSEQIQKTLESFSST